MLGQIKLKQKESNMTYFDDKQKKLINSWHSLSEKSEDFYMAFMAEWIAFNAICYNLYYERAVMEKASIDRSKSKLSKIQDRLEQTANLSATEAKLESKNEKWNINIRFPDRLFLSISKKYTEDRIFEIFAEKYSDWYQSDAQNNHELFEEIKKSLTKKINSVDRHFVINMSRIKDYSSKIDIDELYKKRIILLCETNSLAKIKEVLYQIRCNIFHGEKTPGDINDDKIVKFSLPMLRYLVNKLMKDYEIKKFA